MFVERYAPKLRPTPTFYGVAGVANDEFDVERVEVWDLYRPEKSRFDPSDDAMSISAESVRTTGATAPNPTPPHTGSLPCQR